MLDAILMTLSDDMYILHSPHKVLPPPKTAWDQPKKALLAELQVIIKGPGLSGLAYGGQIDLLCLVRCQQ